MAVVMKVNKNLIARIWKEADLKPHRLSVLGHASIRTTERYYAPYVKSHQRVLDAAVAKLDFGESGSAGLGH